MKSDENTPYKSAILKNEEKGVYLISNPVMNIIFAMIDNNIRSKLMKNIPLIRYIYVLLPVLLLITLTSFSTTSTEVPYRIKTIVIDAGHGGHDGATRGLFSKEKD